MDTDKLQEVSNLVKSLDVNLTSEHAESVAKRYLVYKLIDDQITNLIWLPVILCLAYCFYAIAEYLFRS